MTDIVVREESRALTPAQQRTESVRKAIITRLPDILPNGMNPARFEAVTIQAIAKNPDLLECEPASIVMAVLEAAQLGLEPTGSLSRAWLIPYTAKGESKPKAQLMIGYQGLVDLARRSGDVAKVTSRVVYEGDEFSVEYGTHEGIHHVPTLTTTDPASVTHVYAIATLRSGDTVFDVMTRDQVEAIRRRSRSANYGPWVSDWAEMARKTVMRRLVKSLPLTAETIDAIARDDEREFNTSGVVAVEPGGRTAAVRQMLASRAGAPEPAQAAPGAAEEAPVEETSAPPVSAQQQAPEPGEVREICGAGSDPALGSVEFCVSEPGHKGPHTSIEGSKWPNGGRK